MIKIYNSDIDNILVEYKKALHKWLCRDELYKNRNYKDKLKSKIGDNQLPYQRMISYISDNLESIICSKPNKLEEIILDFNNKFNTYYQEYLNETDEKKDETPWGNLKKTMKGFYERFFSDMSKIIGFEEYKNGVWLAKKLNIKVCPYCNRQYTFTINHNDVSTRHEFDHFYPKSVYPYLALSFYNLVPSCSTCNHIKREIEIEINPYANQIENEFKFMLDTKDGQDINTVNWVLEKKNIEVTFTNQNDNIKHLALKELYNEHIDYIEEIIDKSHAYNLSYYNSIINSYRGLGKQHSEIDRFVWGAYLEEAEHSNRPLSKLTRDVLEQLKIK